MNRLLNNFLKLAVALGCVASFALAVDARPDPDELLRAMRDMTVSQGNKDVTGSIRKNSTKIPFSLAARGETIAFQYKEGGAWKRFDVRIRERNADLLVVQGKKAQVMSPSMYAQKIAGTDVCYEDLSLRFLYWRGGKLIDDPSASRIKGRDCYIVQVVNPQPGVGQFASMRLWVDKENGTTWQMDGYGRDGKLIKRFTITSVQRLKDGTWFFKQMKLEIRDPQNPNRTISLDYIEMDDLPGKK